MTKLWMLATGVPDRMLAAGWGTPLHWLAAQAPAVDTAHGAAQLVVGFAVNGGLDAADASAVETALRAYAPDARVLETHSHDWNGDPWCAASGQPSGGLGHPPGSSSDLTEPHGRVLFAGSDVALEHPGWIAGAIASGHAQARAALDVLGAQ